jgi:hypothetical protein
MPGRVKIIALVEADSREAGLALFHQHSPSVPMNEEHIPDEIPIIYRIVSSVDDKEKVTAARRPEWQRDGA